MAMEGLLRSSSLAALLFLTLVLVAASASASCGGGDDVAAAIRVPSTADTAVDDDEHQAGYMLVGMETSGGDKNWLVVVADQSYFSITGHAQGFSRWPRWFFSNRHRHLPLLGGGNGSSSSHGSSYAEVVASSLVAALMNAGRSCG
jgi:hypothetical protein